MHSLQQDLGCLCAYSAVLLLQCLVRSPECLPHQHQLLCQLLQALCLLQIEPFELFPTVHNHTSQCFKQRESCTNLLKNSVNSVCVNSLVGCCSWSCSSWQHKGIHSIEHCTGDSECVIKYMFSASGV